MSTRRIGTFSLSVALAWLLVGPVFAAEPETPATSQATEQPFLSDYSKLQPAPDNPFDEIYIAADAAKRLGEYTAVMVDQPELFIHPESSYKGIKPDDMKAIADALRERVTTELQSGGYQLVDQPAANVLYVRLAVGDLVLAKKKRSVLSYTPVGAVVHASKRAMQDIPEKVNLQNMKVEAEVLDSVTLEQLGALTTSRGSLSTATVDPTKQVTWNELDYAFSALGKRLRCRLDNSKKPEEQHQNCGAIGLAPVVTTAAEE